jgi:hypothetical protein
MTWPTTSRGAVGARRAALQSQKQGAERVAEPDARTDALDDHSRDTIVG